MILQALCVYPQIPPHAIVFSCTSAANKFRHPLRPSLSHHLSESLLPQAASISSSAADYPGEDAVGDAGGRKSPPTRPRRRSVAGVDQDYLVDPRALADADSFFCEFNGVDLHHKICHYEETDDEKGEMATKLEIPIVLLHGFGASAFSWDRVMKPLSRLVGSKVLAFDRPAFGLTSRRISRTGGMDDDALVRPLNPYSMSFSVLATLFFVDLLAAGKEEKKAILMGHSAGCLVAVETYLEAPERVAALILVSPAIFAPLSMGSIDQEKEMGKGDERNGDSNFSIASANSFMRFWKSLINLYMRLMRMTLKILKGMRDMVGSLFIKAISALLRSTFAMALVRTIMDNFGTLAIRYAWCDPNKVTDYVIQGYTKPLKAKDWEMALLEYTLAVLAESASKPPLSTRFAQISCPVLIVTGDSDRIVPAWNAERLSRAIPGSSFEKISKCGHLPHEEKVQEFLLAVEIFLQKALGAPNVRLICAAA